MHGLRWFFAMVRLAVAIGRKDLAAIATAVRRVDRLDPADPSILELAAQAHLGLGQHDEAAEVVERLLEVDPDHRNGLQWMAFLCQRRGETAAAFYYLRRWLELTRATGEAAPASLSSAEAWLDYCVAWAQARGVRQEDGEEPAEADP